MAQSLTSFVNQNWDYTTLVQSDNSYPKAGIDLTLYDSTNYDTYVTFLAGNEASNKVDEDVSYLTQGTLDNFN